MKRFIDLRGQGTGSRFAWYDTVRDEFEVHGGAQDWITWSDFIGHAGGYLTEAEIARYNSLCPPWVFEQPPECHDCTYNVTPDDRISCALTDPCDVYEKRVAEASMHTGGFCPRCGLSLAELPEYVQPDEDLRPQIDGLVKLARELDREICNTEREGVGLPRLGDEEMDALRPTCPHGKPIGDDCGLCDLGAPAPRCAMGEAHAGADEPECGRCDMKHMESIGTNLLRCVHCGMTMEAVEGGRDDGIVMLGTTLDDEVGRARQILRTFALEVVDPENCERSQMVEIARSALTVLAATEAKP